MMGSSTSHGTLGLKVTEQAALSHPGLRRTENEDNHFEGRRWFAIADGMGGEEGGEIASAVAIDAFWGVEDAGGRPTLAGRIETAARWISARASQEARLGRMGTTLVAARLTGGSVEVAHVGDSRAYRWREGKLEQLTQDHTIAAELSRRGHLPPEKIATHPLRSVLSRWLGPQGEGEPDVVRHPARPGDVYLLCTDGLTDEMPDDEIAAVLRDAGSLEGAAQGLIDGALAHGGHDNVTVILFAVDKKGGSDGGAAIPAARPPVERRRSGTRPRPPVAA